MPSFLDTLEDEEIKEEPVLGLPEKGESSFLDTLDDEGVEPSEEKLALPDEPVTTISKWEPTLFDRMKSVFRDPAKESANAAIAMIDSKMLNISPSQAMRLRNPIDRGIKINPAAAKIRKTLSERLGGKLDKGYAQVNSGLWNYDALIGNETPEVLAGIKETEDFLSQPEAISEGVLEDAVGAAAEMFPFLARSAYEGSWRGVILAGGTMLMGTAAGVPEVTYPLAAPMYAVGQTSASLEFVSKVEAGLAYSELRNYQDPVTGEKIDPTIAKASAYGVGAINGLLELAQMKTLIKTIPGGKKLLSGAILDTVKEVAEKKSLQDVAAKHLKRYGQTIVTETLQETAQESTNIVADIFARKLTNELKGTELSMPEVEEITARLAETMKTSAQAFAVMGLPGQSVSTGYDVVKQKRMDKAFEKSVADDVVQDVDVLEDQIKTITNRESIARMQEDILTRMVVSSYEILDEELTTDYADLDQETIDSFVDIDEILGDEVAEDKFIAEKMKEAGFEPVDVEEDTPGAVSGIDQTKTPEFKKWSGGNAVVERFGIIDSEAGTGKIFKVYHGTTNTFDVFDPSKKGTKEGQFGSVNYFTSDKGDADINYAGEGPDLTNRIELRSEQIEQELEDIEEETALELAKKYNLEFDPETETYPDGLPEVLAREELSGGQPQTLEVYVKSDNPAYIGGVQETWIENTDEESYREDATKDVLDENDATKDQIDEYQDEIRDRMFEMAQDDEPEIFIALQQAINESGSDVDAVQVYQELDLFDPEITATELEDRMRQSDTLMYAEDEMGTLVQSHIIGNVFKNLGFDSIILQNANERFKNMDMGPGTAHVHVFEETPTNIKSATENIGAFDPDDPNIKASIAPVWYSALERGVENIKQETAPAQQWQGMIKKLPIKKEEMEWVGLEDWLKEQKGKVPKQDILDFVRANNVEVQEVEKGGVALKESTDDYGQDIFFLEEWPDDGYVVHLTESTGEYQAVVDNEFEGNYPTKEEAAEAVNDYYDLPEKGFGEGGTKFSEYQLPGGENYKELLLTLPAKGQKTVEQYYKSGQYAKDYADIGIEWESLNDYQKKLVAEGHAEAGNKDTREIDYKSSHFDEPNVLAHIRFNERTDAEGNKVLFLEEIQSDFLQAHRKAVNMISETVENDFKGIVSRMEKAGILKEIC